MKKTIICVVTVVVLGSLMATAGEQREAELEKRIVALEKRVAALEGTVEPVTKEINLEAIRDEQRKLARTRMSKDAQTYSREERREIETLYQVANKEWRTDAARESLKKLVSEYKHSNRTGCALLYLGRMSKGDDRETYLKQAIEDFSDCFYGDGTNVGGYARFCLGYHYRGEGDNDAAEKLFAELRKDYPHAIDHGGRLITGLLEQE